MLRCGFVSISIEMSKMESDISKHFSWQLVEKFISFTFVVDCARFKAYKHKLEKLSAKSGI